MQDEDEWPGTRLASELPSLAARDRPSPPDDDTSPTSPTAHESAATGGTTRRARLSHRSRAGCWTCRGRKVKCDEQRPRCGQCLRLNRECDWEHRWNFNHATSTTRSRHTNVLTSGSAVWDPRARPGAVSLSRSTSNDNLPAFATLTNDDDRERKARSAVPGTYSVVVTPESFANLPEYASSGSNSPTPRLVSEQGWVGNQGFGMARRNSSIDTNTVLLDQFEDTSPSTHVTTAPHSFSSRSSSLPGGLLNPPSHMYSNVYPAGTPSLNTGFGQDDRLSACFDQHIIYRLIPWINDTGVSTLPNLATNRDFFQDEASRFPPLRAAIDALSALHLCYAGQARLATAVSFYDQALAIATPLDQDDHLSDGVFLRHFLLYAYDIIMLAHNSPSSSEEASMSATNLNALQRLAVQRFERNGGERFAYIVWLLCLLDLEACLMGVGACDFVREVLQNNVMPNLARQIHAQQSPTREQSRDTELLVLVLDFNQGIVVQLAKMAALAKSLRDAVASRLSDPLELLSQCQAAAQQAQKDLRLCWRRLYPGILDSDPSEAARSLPRRIRSLFDHTVTIYGAGIIYSHTSMFPRQRAFQTGDQSAIDAEIEACKDSILEVASNMLATQQLDQRWIVFPVFMAGIASKQSDAMVQAMDIIRGYENSGIGQNTTVVRRLLTAINEEQSQRVSTGLPMEDIDWHAVASERGFRISNCGL